MYYSQLEKNATRIGCREERDELDHTVGHAVPFADTVVATREEDADATHTELREQVARLHYVSPRAPILVDAVRRTDRLRDPRLVEDEVKPGEVQVFCAQRPSAGAVEDVRRRMCGVGCAASDTPWPQCTGCRCSPRCGGCPDRTPHH